MATFSHEFVDDNRSPHEQENYWKQLTSQKPPEKRKRSLYVKHLAGLVLVGGLAAWGLRDVFYDPADPPEPPPIVIPEPVVYSPELNDSEPSLQVSILHNTQPEKYGGTHSYDLSDSSRNLYISASVSGMYENTDILIYELVETHQALEKYLGRISNASLYLYYPPQSPKDLIHNPVILVSQDAETNGTIFTMFAALPNTNKESDANTLRRHYAELFSTAYIDTVFSGSACPEDVFIRMFLDYYFSEAKAGTRYANLKHIDFARAPEDWYETMRSLFGSDGGQCKE